MSDKQEILNNLNFQFDSKTVIKGQSYYKAGLVKKLSVKYDEDGDIFINSQVEGTFLYTQEILIDSENYSIDGDCSCPVGYNCKHVAAAIFQFTADYTGIKAKKESSFVTWLNKLVLQKENLDIRLDNNYFLTYRLFLNEWGSELEFYKSKILKSGQVSKGIKLSKENFFYSYEYNYYDFLSNEDMQLIPILKPLATGYSDDVIFKDELGAIALKKLAKTNRAFFKDSKTPLRFIEQKKRVEFKWESAKNGSRLVSNLSQSEFAITKTSPPLCIDSENNTLFELESEVSNEKLELLLNAPTIPKENLGRAVQTIIQIVPESKVEFPKDLEIEELKENLTPYLYIYGQEIGSHKTHFMEMKFFYGDYEFDCDSKEEYIFLKDKNIKVIRDFAKEQECKDYIESLGFEYSAQNRAYLSLAKPSLQEAIERWRVFIDEEANKLRQKGWRVEIDKSFAYQFEYSEDIFADFEDEEGSNWFNLSFKVSIGGQKLDLLPIITPLLSEFDTIEELPPKLNLKLPSGKFLHINSSEVKPILNTIYELFDRETDNKIVIKPYDAHLLNFGENVVWKGANELKKLAKELKNFKGIEQIEPSAKLNAKLREYQKQGISWLNFLHKFNFGGILADDMGLGKTIQTLSFLQYLKEQGGLNKPSLVIMPTSLIGNWKNEIEKFTPDLRYLELYGTERSKLFKKIENYDIILTTYNLIVRDLKHYEDKKFEYIILDEAQKIKNPQTKMAKSIKGLKSSYKLALTGTPIENHLGELWSIFDFLMSGFLGSLKEFRGNFQTPIEKEKSIKKQELLNRKLAPFILRRTKDEVVKELPPKTEIIKKVALGAKQAALYENIRVAMEKKVRDAIKQKGLNRSHIMILDALLKLRQVCCHPQLLKLKSAQNVKESAKLEMFLELIDTLMAEGKKVLVFSQFTSMLSILEEQIKLKKIKYSKLTGATRKRQEAIEKFTKGDAQIFLISLKAGGVGLNLIEADTVIHYDPWWNPAVENQATDRAYRIGQKKAVFVYKLVVENSIEEKIIELQKKKQSIQDGIYDKKEQESLKGEELIELLSI